MLSPAWHRQLVLERALLAPWRLKKTPAAFAVASLLALLALATLGIKTFLEWKQAREHALAQQTAAPEATSELETAFLPRTTSK